MIARGFKPVGWVATVGGAALGCYMLSLNVAAERAELAQVERRIVAAKQDIRALQTELGTRGRLTQLEHWNADVLALSAPGSTQFLEDEFTLARFSQPDADLGESAARVRMASADSAIAPAARPAITGGAAPAATPLLRQASYSPAMAPASKPAIIKTAAAKASLSVPVKSDTPRESSAKTAPATRVVKTAAVKASPVKKAPPPSSALFDADLIAEIGATAQAENIGGAGGR